MPIHNLNLNKQIISLFSGQASTLTTPKLYVQLTGNHTLAIVLNQCVFWSNKSELKNGWFYKQYHEWFSEIHIPERTLRRIFDKLEQFGWITTKVKKIHGVNVKHVMPNMDKIVDSISIMLSADCPDRPKWPDKEYSPDNEQENCTKVDPTGHFGRSEPATLSDSSIYTEENIQKKLTNYSATSHENRALTNCESSSSFFFNEMLDRQMLAEKLPDDRRSEEEFLTAVATHVEKHSDSSLPLIVRQQGALRLLRKLKKQNEIFYVKGTAPKESNQPQAIPKNETHEERMKRYHLENQAWKRKK